VLSDRAIRGIPTVWTTNWTAVLFPSPLLLLLLLLLVRNRYQARSPFAAYIKDRDRGAPLFRTYPSHPPRGHVCAHAAGRSRYVPVGRDAIPVAIPGNK